MNILERLYENVEDVYIDDFNRVFDRGYLHENIKYSCVNNNSPIFRLHNNGKEKLWYTYKNGKIVGIKFSELFLMTSHGFGGTSFNFMFSLDYKTNKKIQFPSIVSDTIENLYDDIIFNETVKIANLEKEILKYNNEIESRNNIIEEIKRTFKDSEKIGYKITNTKPYENKEE